MLQHLLHALQEPEPQGTVATTCAKSIKDLGPEVVWDCYEAVYRDNAPGRVSQFTKVLMKKKQQQDIRYATSCNTLTFRQ